MVKKEKIEYKEVAMKDFWLSLWNLLEPSRKRIKGLVGFIMIFEIMRLIGPYILKLIIDSLINFDIKEIWSVISLIALMLASEQTVALLAYFKDKKTFEMLVNIEFYLPVSVHKKLVFLSMNYHKKENTGNKITKIERGMNKINDLLANTFFEVIPTLLQLLVTIIILFIVDWRFGLSFMMFAPLFIYLTFKINRELAPTRAKRHKDYEVASGKMGESIININTVKSFVQESAEVKNFQSLKEIIRGNEIKEWYRLLRFGLRRNIIIDLGRVTILLLGTYLIWRGSVTVGTLVFVITLSEKSYFSLYRLSRFYDRIQEGSAAVNRFVKVFNEKSDIVNLEKAIKPKSLVGEIEFKDINFSYEDDSVKALENVNLKIGAGSVTALVGPSGGGKTTVARMIYRHYDPQEGQILVDGKNIKEYDLFEFRKFIAIVPQEVEIFNRSVKDNIAYAKSSASLEEVKEAARIANAEEFIEKLPDGYDTLVGERGIKLSGGQRQRLGIARAILANPRILIFDEATSSLDSYSEKLIQDAMEKVSKGRTTIIIAHRLSTIKKADQIIVLEGGKVAESGSHDELSHADKGLYAKLLNLQRMGDVD